MFHNSPQTGLLERLQRRGGCDRKPLAVLSSLQPPKAASIAGLPDAGSRLLWRQKGCRFAAQCLMSFKGMGKSIQKGESADPKTGAPSHLLEEFPPGYSSAGCSSAEPASASPAEANYATLLWRRSMDFFRAAFSLTKHIGSESTLRTPIFCPADGVHLITPDRNWL